MDKLQAKEQGIRDDYEAMKPNLSSWGNLVDENILSLLSQSGLSESKIQIPPKHRIKTTESLIGRAIYDKTVESSNPLKGVPDKVGTRIVLTSKRDVLHVIEVLKEHTELWKARISRGPEKHMRNPKEFDYASVHLELIPTQSVSFCSAKTKKEREWYKCEVQIRTLLQHAFAEVAHDTIYKGPYSLEGKLVRLLSRGQALMEVTDEHFERAYTMIDDPTIYETAFTSKLKEFGGKIATATWSSKIDVTLTNEIYQQLNVQDTEVESVNRYIQQNIENLNAIFQVHNSYIFSQPVVIFLMYKINRNALDVQDKWELDPDILESLAFSLGVTLR